MQISFGAHMSIVQQCSRTRHHFVRSTFAREPFYLKLRHVKGQEIVKHGTLVDLKQPYFGPDV